MGADSNNFGVVNEARERAQRRQTFEGFLLGHLDCVVRQVAQRISVALVMPGWPAR